ncbi:hypothetical protein SPRG_13365 [Saprolegnia parasitica CBS 223.65]|uniref:START domain-containing protein n=1 Tax=Saprolegnia parasitica (strain CBS 223.65) TaxID=695850 RepID=A0A067BSQ1_SAPPC|nr:hypothetical protein SPRG_13365 [Saprolegnia parasitica CBS 223.65]KDO21554.1 hypothetical protein SPRG_13365 [Saprolegnia parasitica CBS 223.65]|eukprot:XP_012207731.1 hypothetical protein SPRG_13365 [Saprolegnia parasitica CBS 223.65]
MDMHAEEMLALDDMAWDLTLDLPPARPKRQRKTYAEEITELRAKAAQYSEQLAALTQRQEVDIICATPWEGISRRQAIERSVAEQDNARLKDAVQEQLTTIQTLLRIVQKRPKLMDVSYVEDWKLQRLPADPALRHRSFHAMLDAEYERLESVFLAQRLYDATETGTHTDAVVENDQLILTCSMVHTIHADIQLVAKALWSIVALEQTVTLETGTLRPLEGVGDSTCYMQFSLHFPTDVELHGNMAWKRYDVSPVRIVFTMKVVHDDEVHPYPPEVYIPQETGWYIRTIENKKTAISSLSRFEIELVRDGVTRVKHFSRGRVPCRSYRDASRQQENGLSFAALADHVLTSYRSNIRVHRTMIDQRLREWTATDSPIFED